jgi:hypothetical protein
MNVSKDRALLSLLMRLLLIYSREPPCHRGVECWDGRVQNLMLECHVVYGIIGGLGCLWIITLSTLWKDINLNSSCVEEWEHWICHLGNFSGLASSCFWSICILPQLWFNYSKRSTKGLSLRWGTANVIAALINLNFILRLEEVPLYMSISAIYMPILEMLMLGQFIFYGENQLIRTLASLIFTLLVIIIVTVSLLWSHLSVKLSGDFMWIAVILWSIETFPQLWMNLRSSSTAGQSPETITISFLGKTTDFVAMVSLDIPLQYRIMTYFSTSSAYLNIVQFLFYREMHSPATLVLFVILSYAFLMILKVGWLLSCLMVSSFLIFFVVGYQLEKYLFPVDPSEEDRGVHDDEIVQDSADTALLKSIDC